MASGGGERIVQANPISLAGGRVIASPFQFYLDGADNLRIEGWNSLTGVSLQVYGRFFKDDGTVQVFQQVLALTADRLRTVGDFALVRGYLLNLVVTAIGASPKIGQTFARVSVIRGLTGGTIVVGAMLQGYVTAQQGLAWPGSPLLGAQEGSGYARRISPTIPAAGFSMFETVPTGARWQLRSVRAGLVTDATAVNRQPYLEAIESGSVSYISSHPQGQGASVSGNYYWADGMPIAVVIATNYTTAGLPGRHTLGPGDQIVITAPLLQPGDQFVSGSLQVQEWLEIE